MGKSTPRMRLFAGVSLSTLALVLSVSGSARAESNDAEIKALRAQVEQLTRTVNKLMAVQAESAAEAKAAKKQASQAEAQAAQAKANAAQAKANAADAQAKSTTMPAKSVWDVDDCSGHRFLEHKPGKDLTFYTHCGEITAYGQLDVSLDGATKNAKSGPVIQNPPNLLGATGDTPVGNFGWMPDISTNISYLGVRGFQRLPMQDFNFVYQFEAGIDISVTPGIKQSNSNLSNSVNGALFSRNSYIGLASSQWGAIKIGKTDAPYKNSTAAFNPFVGTWGDYAVIMGNSGGDNRVEFGTRLSHSVWYESPNINGFQFNLLFSPGQNRATDSSNLSSGESDCAGGNDPTSGGNPLLNCSDGAYSNAASANLSYTNGPLYMTAAAEWHQKVNRSSDVAGAYAPIPAASPPCSGIPTALGQQLCNEDVGDEWAAKYGIMYAFPTKTTIGGIVEYMHRSVPADLTFQNERTRWGTWLVVGQELNPRDSLYFGWAHAFRSPGNPGQHNDTTITLADGTAYGGPNQNQSNMVTAEWKHKFSENLIWYNVVAATFNGADAHYDLGAGGRSVTTDCHDAVDATGGITSGPHCWTGTTLVGVSTGLQWKF